MPSLGHVAVGLSAARFHSGATHPQLAPTLVFTALATFPDLDVLARRLGADPGSAWLHRGALHSLAVAAGAGLAATLIAGGLGRTQWRMAATAVLVAASHGLLDRFTYGGRGVMLLWPFGTTLSLAGWHLLPAAPIGLRLISSRGAVILLQEAALFSPFLVYALWPARWATPASTSCRARPEGL